MSLDLVLVVDSQEVEWLAQEAGLRRSQVLALRHIDANHSHFGMGDSKDLRVLEDLWIDQGPLVILFRIICVLQTLRTGTFWIFGMRL